MNQQYYKQYYLKNKEKYALRARERREKIKREETKEEVMIRKEKNRTKAKKRYHKNIEKSRKYALENRKKKPELYKKIKKKNLIKKSIINKQLVLKLKMDGKCSKCGLEDYRCLDFHHINPCDKKKDICSITGTGYSTKYLLKEIAKCELICRNCHKLEHNRAPVQNTKKAKFVAEYKQSRCCEHCGFKHFKCLEFHHVSGIKIEIIGYMMHRGQFSLEDIQKEIAKCILLCSNCHKIFHYQPLIVQGIELEKDGKILDISLP